MQKPPERMPLKNYRVLDLSRIWAGPYCTKLFADMGAEIIKMESLSVYDSHRGPVNPAKGIAAYPDGEPGDEPWNRNGWFNCLHMSKYGVTLELTKDEGRRVFELLVSISDVVIENFRQGSLERLGYTYEELRKHRPDLIYVSMPAFGNTGPWKGYLGYGIGQEQLSGMAHMTGYRGEGPMKSGINHGDPITGSHAAGVLMAALRHRRRTGKGMYIDVSQQESSVALMGPEVLAYQMTGQEPERRGNRSGWYAPANSYRCAGEDRWVTIAATNQDQWRSLAQAMDADGLADDPRFATKEARRENHDDLDRIISEWTIGLEAYDLTRKLQRLGVPAGPVLRGPDLLQDAHYKDRGTFVTVDHPQVGPKQYPGIPWKMSATPGVVRWPSPTLGQHNREVYGELLGLNGLEIDQLDQTGVIGTKPTGSRII
ncbi:MAG: CoA transferase [SAR202 cluster bacterium]|nr:CoA transferase [SAR202 cluster bacterium]MQG65011.1 CoA transferase [SAR202 cluster bacterium]